MGVNSEKFVFGTLKKGKRNLITDVPGVKVGHVTLSDGEIQTGVTAVIPGEGSAFRSKFPAAVHVINGFGKSAGLVQIEELGTLETPILMTNTLSVAACLDGLLTYMLEDHPEIGVTTGTVNCVVTECNDGVLNDIRGRHVKPEHALQALAAASEDFAEGAVGAGRGMKNYGWKGGIGSASRIVSFDGKEYTVGALLLTNFGKKPHLTICGRHIGEEGLRREDLYPEGSDVEKVCGEDCSQGRKDRAVQETAQGAAQNAAAAAAEDDSHLPYAERDKGSCIMLLATDLPLSSRQLKRCAHRAQNGLARTGSQTGGGSGEIVLMFSTANRIPHSSDTAVLTAEYLHEDKLDPVFAAVAEAVEESVVSSMVHAEAVTGFMGHSLEALVK